MFKPNSWYFVKSIHRGGDLEILKSIGKLQIFKVRTIDSDGYVIEIESVSGKVVTGPQHLGRALLHPKEAKFFKEFEPSGNTCFTDGICYAPIDSGILDCLTNRGRGYTALRNFLRGYGFVKGRRGIFRPVMTTAYGVTRAFGKAPAEEWNVTSQWLFTLKSIPIPHEFAMFFRKVKSLNGNPELLEDLEPASDAQTAFVDSTEEQIAEYEVKRANQRTGLAVTFEDMELLNAIKYLLTTREIFTGKRTRLAYMEETYTRDSIKSAEDIVALANQRREEIDKYREEQKRKIEYAHAALQEIEEL